MPGDVDLGRATGHIEIESSGAQRGAQQAGQALSSLDEAVRNNWWGLRNLGMAFGAFSVAVAGSFAMAVGSAVKWENAMAGVERTSYDATKSAEYNREAIAGLSDDLRGLATIKPLQAEQLAGIAEAAGALGLKREDIAGFTSVVADLAATTDLTEDVATTSLARIAGIMGLPTAQFQNLASSILETGRSTQATEPEIVKLATRLAGIGKTVGLSSAELVGLSAAVSSVGIRAEMGATAIQKTFIDMINAISKGGTELEVFSKVAGMTGEEFTKLFQEDAAAALTAFVGGLGKMQSSGQNVVGVLDSLGIREARQTQTLLRLGAAQDQNVNQNLKLSTSLGISTKAFQENTALSQIAGRRYATAAAQITILKNLVAETGRTYGVLFLPVLKAVVGILQNFLKGMAALPGPMRVVITVLTGLTAVAFGLIAAVLLLGPRIILINLAIKQLAASSIQAAGGVATAGTAIAVTGAQASVSAKQLATFNTLFAAQNRLGPKVATNVANTGVAAAGATPLIAKLAQNAGKFVKVLGVLIGLASIAAAAITYFGSKQKAAVDPATQQVEVNQALVDAIEKTTEANSQAADEFLVNALAMAKVIPIAKRLGFTMAETLAIIKGTADAQLAKKFVSAIMVAEKGGDKGAKKLGDSVQQLRLEWKAANEVASASIAARSELGMETEELTETTKDLAKAEKDAAQKLEESNRAIMSLVDAYFGQRQAVLDLQDAQDRLNELMEEARNPTRALEKAELDLQSSRIAAARANEEIAKAELKLSEARAKQQDELLDAQDALSDAHEKYTDSLESIHEAQERLNDLRSGPTLDELRDATNKLRAAELRLVDSHQALEDAEWQLNYLREENASNRDLVNAERILEEARLGVMQSEDELIDSTEELQKLREGATPEELIAAERDVQSAYRDSEQALRDISEQEREVSRIRQEIANDTAYREAERELQEAHISAAQAADRAQDSERELDAARKIGIETSKEMVRQNLEVEQSIYRLAQANAEVRKQQALSRGEFVDSGREAQWLAGELESLAAHAPDEASRKRLSGMAATLRKSTPGKPPDEGDEGGGPPDLGGQGGVAIPDSGEVDKAFGDMNKGIDTQKSKWGSLKETISNVLAGITGAIVGAKIGGLIGGMIGGPVGAVLGFAAGALVGIIVQKLLAPIIGKILEYGPQWIENFLKFFRELPGNIAEIGGKIIRAVTDFVTGIPEKFTDLRETLVEKISSAFGAVQEKVAEWLSTISTKVIEWVTGLPDTLLGLGEGLRDKIDAAWDALYEGVTTNGAKVINWFVELPGKIVEALGNIGSTFMRKGREAINGIVDGVQEKAPKLLNWFIELPGKIWDGIGDIGKTLMDVGRNAVYGIWNGLVDKAQWLFDKVWEWIKDVIPGPIQKALGIASPSKLMRTYGQFAAQGIMQGLLDEQSSIEATSKQMAKTVSDTFGAANFGPPTRSFAPFDARAVNTAARAGGASSAPAGDTINISTVVQDAEEISDVIAWKKIVRTRS